MILLTMKSRANVVIIKESAAMGSLFTIWANDELLCKDLPRKKALNQLDKYLIGV